MRPRVELWFELAIGADRPRFTFLAVMRFVETSLSGLFVVELEPITDARGFFARSFCEREFGQHGLQSSFVQCNISHNRQRGTLRGMHYQCPPAQEVKLVRCTRGSLLDVAVDLRENSPTHYQHVGLVLSAEKRNALYIPAGFAHGFQTLEDDTEVFYQMGNFHSPEHAAGFRYDDPRFAIRWPLPVSVISEKDLAWPLLG